MNERMDIRKILDGKIVLIIEDDTELAGDLREVFEEMNAKVEDKGWMEAARGEIQEHGDKYDLIVLDIMLPRTKEEYYRIKVLAGELDDVRVILEKEDRLREGNVALLEELEKAYDKRSAILREKESLINIRGGIELVKDLMGGENPQKLPPILVLTAVGNQAAAEEGMALLGENGEWVVKPVGPNLILETAARLLSKVGTNS